MREGCFPDEELVQWLPMPLAQLYRRAHNAKTALERHNTAFFLWEASLVRPPPVRPALPHVGDKK